MKFLTGITVAASKLWNHLWFQDKNTLPLDVMRAGIGFLMFFNYAMFAPEDILALYGDSGLFSLAVVPEMNNLVSFSLFTFFDQPWQVLTFHYVFVSLCFCLMIGWHTREVKWLVLLGHLTYLNRNLFLFYGVDIVETALLFILCLAPIGNAICIDRIIRVKKYKLRCGIDSILPLQTSRRGFACQRLLQFQMAVIFFYAGFEKLKGHLWRTGEAPWYALNNYEVAFMPMGVFAEHYWLIYLIAYAVIILEIGYPFLIWGKSTRLYILCAALLLHAGIALFMGMYYFAAVMACGHLVFMRRSWYVSAGEWWKKKAGVLEIYYNGNCGYCRKLMTLVMAFDGLQQITPINYRVEASSVVVANEMGTTFYAGDFDGRLYEGFEACRYTVARIPGLWWIAPLFYIPFLSRLMGQLVSRGAASYELPLSKVKSPPLAGSASNK